jgi:membrane protease YdiL (CAAX protease family)
MLEELLLFDSSKPAPDWTNVFIYSAVIIIATQLTFMALTKLMGIDNVNIELDSEKDNEYAEWQKKNISPWSVLFTEIVSSSIYSPIAEELMFRVLLMKFVFSKQLGLNNWTSNILQSLIFGGMHLTNTVFSTQTSKYTKLQTLSATIAGLISGWTYYHTNSIMPSLIAHFINNASAGMSEVIGYSKHLRTKQK